MLTYLQDEVSSDHKDPDRYLYTTCCLQKINGYELAPGAALTQFLIPQHYNFMLLNFVSFRILIF